MRINKRLIFLVTSGRSGSKYLANVLLKHLPGIVSQHEPLPGFHEHLPQARHDPALAKKFLLEQKLPYIERFPETTYIETSHYFAKGFLDPLLDLGIVPDLILLKRDARKIARSWFLIGEGVKDLHAGKHYEHMIGPHEPNFLPAQGFMDWYDYQLMIKPLFLKTRILFTFFRAISER